MNNNTTNSFEGGLYYDRDDAEDAVNRLHGLGYGQDDISVMAKDKERAAQFAESTGTKASTGAVTGGAIGGALGAIVAGLTATGSIAAIAGTGGAAAPLVVGPLAAALAGLGGGGLVGGIIGGLVGAGIPEDKAREYEEGLNKGGMLIGVHPRDEHRDQVRSIFTPTGTSDSTGTSTGTIDSRSSTSVLDDSDTATRGSSF